MYTRPLHTINSEGDLGLRLAPSKGALRICHLRPLAVQPPAAIHAASSVPLALDIAVAGLLYSAGVSADVVGRPRAVVGSLELALALARPLAQATHEERCVPRPGLFSLTASEQRLHDATGGCSSGSWRTISSRLNIMQQWRHTEHGQPQQVAPLEEGPSPSHERRRGQRGGQRAQRARRGREEAMQCDAHHEAALLSTEHSLHNVLIAMSSLRCNLLAPDAYSDSNPALCV